MSAAWAHMVWQHLAVCQPAPYPIRPEWAVDVWQQFHHLACDWFTG